MMSSRKFPSTDEPVASSLHSSRPKSTPEHTSFLVAATGERKWVCVRGKEKWREKRGDKKREVGSVGEWKGGRERGGQVTFLF